MDDTSDQTSDAPDPGQLDTSGYQQGPDQPPAPAFGDAQAGAAPTADTPAPGATTDPLVVEALGLLAGTADWRGDAGARDRFAEITAALEDQQTA